jgi:hypothetical protein
MIFVSYSRTREWADAVRRSAGALPVWLDHEQLDLVQPLADQIAAAIERSESVLVLESEASRGSAWVAFERMIARRYGRPVWSLRDGRVPSDLGSFTTR